MGQQLAHDTKGQYQAQEIGTTFSIGYQWTTAILEIGELPNTENNPQEVANKRKQSTGNTEKTASGIENIKHSN